MTRYSVEDFYYQNNWIYKVIISTFHETKKKITLAAAKRKMNALSIPIQSIKKFHCASTLCKTANQNHWNWQVLAVLYSATINSLFNYFRGFGQRVRARWREWKTVSSEEENLFFFFSKHHDKKSRGRDTHKTTTKTTMLMTTTAQRRRN